MVGILSILFSMPHTQPERLCIHYCIASEGWGDGGREGFGVFSSLFLLQGKESYTRCSW